MILTAKRAKRRAPGEPRICQMCVGTEGFVEFAPKGRSYCKECSALLYRAWVVKNREKRKELNKRNYHQRVQKPGVRERINEKQKKLREMKKDTSGIF